ncbi:MAG TPA: hypothetical protein VK116_15250, partial [Planctomycetota bacterium]|nr:hypothetical protein [Planctomycetota bacterium]
MTPRLASRPNVRSRGGGSALAPIILACAIPLLGSRAHAQVVVEETYEIATGFNLVHFPFDPLDKDATDALATIDWESIWTWLPDSSGASSSGQGGRWLVRFRDEPAFLSTLASLAGPASYVIRARAGGTLRVAGSLRPDSQGLLGGAYQLFGPMIKGSPPPTLEEYFSRAGAEDSIGPVYELAGGTYRKLSRTDPLRRGAAYWVRPLIDLPHPHPLRLGAGRGGLRFDARTSLQEIEIDLGGGAAAFAGGARELEVRAIPSIDASGAADWLDLQEADGSFVPLDGPTTLEIEPGVTRVRLALRARQEALASEVP